MTETAFSQQMNAMQRMLALPFAFSGPMQKNAFAFWENQDKILNEMQDFTNGWFERRHLGTRAALEASEGMCKADNPAVFLREYQEWANGALQRLIADGMACHQMMMSCGATTQAAAQSESPGSPETPSQPHGKAHTRPKAA